MKMDKKAKIKMVKEHIEEFVTLKELEEKYGVGIDHIKYMIALYRKHGEKSFSDEIRKYTRETKLEQVKISKLGYYINEALLGKRNGYLRNDTLGKKNDTLTKIYFMEKLKIYFY